MTLGILRGRKSTALPGALEKTAERAWLLSHGNLRGATTSEFKCLSCASSLSQASETEPCNPTWREADADMRLGKGRRNTQSRDCRNEHNGCELAAASASVS